MISSEKDAGERHNDLLQQTRDTQTTIQSMPAGMVAMLRGEHWRRLMRPKDHRVFENATLADWVLGPPWPGLGFPNWATLYALLEKNPEYGPECLTLLRAGGAPSAQEAERVFQATNAKTKGKPPKLGANQHGGCDDITPSPVARGTGAEYLSRRLLRDHPAIFGAFERGDYPSVRAAAIAAGLPVSRGLSVSATNLDRALAKLITHYGLDAVRKALASQEETGKGGRP
jgi:hypothetical protein